MFEVIFFLVFINYNQMENKFTPKFLSNLEVKCANLECMFLSIIRLYFNLVHVRFNQMKFQINFKKIGNLYFVFNIFNQIMPESQKHNNLINGLVQ